MEDITEFLIETVKEASELITEDFVVKSKDDKGDLVTNFDYEVEKYIADKLKEKYPNYDIVSEELYKDNKVTNNCFVIDPIDGTVNFANNIPLWCIQIACVSNGETISSVIYIPKMVELYYADETGAYLNGEKIHVSNVPLEKGLFCIEGYDPYSGINKMLEKYNNERRLCSAGIEFAYVACGKITGIKYSDNVVYNYYPGIYLIKQAGGVICDEDMCHIGANSIETLEKIKKQS